MFDNIANDSRVYTDLQGLENLHGELKKHPNAVKKEVAKQFEAILMQMMLHSMRDANKAFSSDLLSNDQMDMYQDIFDKQLSLVMSNNSVGFAKMIETNITQNEQGALIEDEAPIEPADKTIANFNQKNQTLPFVTQPAAEENIQAMTAAAEEIKVTPAPNAPQNKPEIFSTQEEFLKKLWPAAKYAAGVLGASPAVLLAQAALETNWGKKVIPHGPNNSTFNLFNIKADSNWTQGSVPMDSLEQKNGVLVKEKSLFRSYGSYKESFMDYVNFLKQNSRYSEAVKAASDPKKFVNALQSAGFATDSAYADKIIKIFSSHPFKEYIGRME